jgi:hypothetical protein
VFLNVDPGILFADLGPKEHKNSTASQHSVTALGAIIKPWLGWVTGAHNTIVTSRAGKDLISCLVSGLLTIGPRFGGAIDDAARYFQDARDRNLDPDEFVEEMKRKGIRVPGIGHRIKSKASPFYCLLANVQPRG